MTLAIATAKEQSPLYVIVLSIDSLFDLCGERKKDALRIVAYHHTLVVQAGDTARHQPITLRQPNARGSVD